MPLILSPVQDIISSCTYYANIRADKVTFSGIQPRVPVALKAFLFFVLVFRRGLPFSLSSRPCPRLLLLRRRFPPASLHEKRVRSVNEITRSNLWHQIPNENMIIVANAEYRARRTEVSRDRRQVGTMISFPFRPIALSNHRSESSFITGQRTELYVNKIVRQTFIFDQNVVHAQYVAKNILLSVHLIRLN